MLNKNNTTADPAQTLFCTEGKGLEHGHGAVCYPELWSVYQSQNSIQSHVT